MPSILEVPLEADGEVLTIDLNNDLPDDPSEICVLLENENCIAKYWLEIGSAYSRNKQWDNAIEVVTRGLKARIVQSETDKAPFYSTLCWLYLSRFRKTPVAEKKEVYEKAVEYGNKAFQLDRSNMAAILARGTLSLSAGSFDDALQPFAALLAKSESNPFAMFGRARVLYHRKNYRGALQLYQAILRQNPNAKPDPRIGIGLCFWKLGDKPHASLAWKRVLALDPESIAANTLIGIWYLDAALHGNATLKEFENFYITAIDFFQTAYKLEAPTSAPLASLGIASYLFSKQDTNKALKLIDRVLQYATLPSLVSDALFWRARILHLTGDYTGALTIYKQAVESNPHNYVASIGKGMIELLQDSPEALLTFEALATSHPSNPEIALYSGFVYAQRSAGDPKRTAKAISALKRYLSLKRAAKETPVPEALLYLAKLLEEDSQMPPVQAHEYLQEAVTQLGDVSVEIFNNRGVLAYYCGHYDEARASLQSALEKANGDEVVTIKFNLARVEDAAGNPELAKEGYVKVLEMKPNYVDAQIRQAYLETVLGDAEKGNLLLDDLMAKHDDNLEVRALQGWSLRRLKLQGAKVEDAEQSHYKHTLMDLDKHDTYSLVAIGNLYLANARELRGASADRKEKAYFKACEFFDKALQIDPANAYAAQGIAIIFAETKRPQQALSIFGRIRETLDDSSVLVNSGHCYAELKQYVKAIEMYEQARGKSSGPDAGILSLLGRAWYAKGASTRDVDALQTALKFSREALELQDVPALQFNVAFIQFQLADVVRRLPFEKRTSKQIADAVDGLKEAIDTLKAISKAEQPPYSASDLEKRAEFGESSVLPQLERAVVEQTDHEREASTKIEESLRVRMEEEEKLAAERKRKREAEEERERQLAEERRALQEQADKWVAEQQAELERQPERKKAKKTEDDFIDDDVMNELGSDADEEEPAPQQASDDEQQRPRRTVVDDDDDDEDNEEEQPNKETSDVDDLF